MKKKKMFGYIAVIAVFTAAFLLMGASCSASTANIQNAVMTTAVDSNGKPADSINTIAVNTPLYAVAELHNAPDGTTVTFKWYAGDTQVDQVKMTNTLTDQYVLSSVDGIAAPGNYKVSIFIDDREQPDASLSFTVK